jgi:hypothetical protein
MAGLSLTQEQGPQTPAAGQSQFGFTEFDQGTATVVHEYPQLGLMNLEIAVDQF